MRTTTTTVTVLATAALVLAGCSSDTGSSSPAADGSVSLVASTNVWASVAAAVAGDAVEVTGIIDDPAADPHSYESTPADAATVTDADLVVLNGGGYDEFMDDVLGTAEGVSSVDAFALSGNEAAAPAGEEVNEHVWYDLPTVAAVATELATRLGELDPADAATFTANAEAFVGEVDALQTRIAAIGDTVDGGTVDVVATEPVADYLVEAAGLTLVSPEEFVEAIEEETDPSAASIAEVDDLLAGGTVGLLVFNTQTVGPVTEDVREAAEAAGIPVLEVTETLPEGVDYLTWMDGQVSALEEALNAPA